GVTQLRAQTCRGVVDDRHRVVAPQHDTRAGQIDGARLPGRVQGGIGQCGEFGQVAPDECAAGVELLALGHRVEDAEIRLRVAPRRCGPLPAAIVGCQVVVVELTGEPGFAPAPVYPQVLD